VAPKHIQMPQVFAAVTPYLAIGFLGLLAIVLFPPLATWLPKVLIR
jgi:TRAP-type mannitol/chloroaromatic compound transport system permease large subunit